MKDEKQAPVPIDLTAVSVLLSGEKGSGTIPQPGRLANEKSGEVPAPAPVKSKPKPRFVPASRWIRFQLWFNTYRYVMPFLNI